MPLKARDVRAKLKGRVDPFVSECIEQLAEQYNDLIKNQTELSMLVYQMSNIITEFVGVAENMKKVIKRQEDDGLDDQLKGKPQ